MQFTHRRSSNNSNLQSIEDYICAYSHMIKFVWSILEYRHDAAIINTPPGKHLHSCQACPRYRLRENVSYLLIHGYVLEPHYSLLHHVFDEVPEDPSKSTLLHDLCHWLQYMSATNICFMSRTRDYLICFLMQLSLYLPLRSITSVLPPAQNKKEEKQHFHGNLHGI